MRRMWPAAVLSAAIAASAQPALALDGVVQRPEIRSYSGARPVQPVRPRIVQPRPVPPLIEDGSEAPYSAQFYAYCAERATGIEPRRGSFLGQPRARDCP